MPSPLLTSITTAVRRRVGAIALLALLPWHAAVFLLSSRLFNPHQAAAITLLVALFSAAFIVLRLRIYNAQWCVRQLNATRSDIEDSADLLLNENNSSPLQALQHQRINQRLHLHPAQLRPAWPVRKLIASACLAALACSAIWLWPAPQHSDTQTRNMAVQTPAGSIKLLRTMLMVAPPAYTRLPPQQSASLSIKTVQASQLRWQLHFSEQPQRVALRFLDGKTLPMQQQGSAWSATMQLNASALYRIEVDGKTMATATPFRLDATPDLPPPNKDFAARAKPHTCVTTPTAMACGI